MLLLLRVHIKAGPLHDQNPSADKSVSSPSIVSTLGDSSELVPEFQPIPGAGGPHLRLFLQRQPLLPSAWRGHLSSGGDGAHGGGALNGALGGLPGGGGGTERSWGL